MGGGASDSEGEDMEDSMVQLEPGQKAIDGARGTRNTKVLTLLLLSPHRFQA